MSRTSTAVSTATALVTLLGACADSSTGPHTELEGPVHGLSAKVVVERADKSSADFTVTPSGGYFELGPHGIYFPENAICDPRTSTYGPTEWDKPCDVLREPIRIHAEIRDRDGQPWVAFTPELRFAPTRGKDAVFIYLKAGGRPKSAKPGGKHVAESNELKILWAPRIGAPGIDESIDDPSLRTFVHRPTGFVFRRIKHFSAYYVRDRAEDGDSQGEDMQ